MSTKKRRPKKGIALIVVLMALLVLGTLAGGLVTVTSGHLMHAYSGNESQEALYAARAGAWMKLAQYRSALNEDPIKETPMTESGATYSAAIWVGDPIDYTKKSKSGAPDIIEGILPSPSAKKGTGFPPPGTVYVEGVGKSSGGKVRKVGILASLSQSRWNNAAFGNNKVEMKSGSYTDSFNSLGGDIDHSKAGIATNNPKGGINITDHKSVAIGWNQGTDASTGKWKKKKDKDSNKNTKLSALASVQGPPGSLEGQVVAGDKNANFSYKTFKTGQSSNQDPVSLPSILPSTLTTADLAGQGTITPDTSAPNPNLNVSGTVSIVPDQAFNYVTVQPNGRIVLDVSGQTPGSKVQYLFTGINLGDKSALEVLQPAAGDVTVQVYINTGDGTDPAAGVLMEGSSVVNPSQNPINLQLLIAGKGKNKLDGHDDAKDGAVPKAYFVAYGPEADIEVRSGQIFGAVVGNNVSLDGDTDDKGNLDPNKAPAVIHYDVSLLEDTGNSPSFNILSVRNY